MSHSIDATDRENLNGHANFDYSTANNGYNTANKITKDHSSDKNNESIEYEKLNRSSGNGSIHQSGVNLDK
jgi:hypothetical protein